MTTGFAVALAFLALFFMAIGLGCGVLTATLRPDGTSPGASFDWGMSFGPIGLAVMTGARARHARRARSGQPAIPPLTDHGNWSLRSSGDALVIVGAIVVVASAFLPWLTARSRTDSLSFAPATEPVLAVGTWIVLAAVVVGSIVFIVRRMVGVVACASAIWFNVSLIYWLLGSTVATWLPSEVLPNNLTASVQAGAAVGLAGSSLALAGAAVHCTERTWPVRAPRIESWTFLGGVGVALVALAGRNMPWIDITAEDFRWVLAVDAVPGIGDVIGLILLVVAGASLVTAVSRWRAPAIVTIVSGVVMLAVAVIAVASGALVERAGAEIAAQIVARDVDVESRVEALLIAPAWFAATGVLAIIIGAADLRRLVRRSVVTARDRHQR